MRRHSEVLLRRRHYSLLIHVLLLLSLLQAYLNYEISDPLIFQQLFDDPFILHFDLNRALYHPPHPLYLSLLLPYYLCVT